MNNLPRSFPHLQLTRRQLLRAAAGTAVVGPWVGTWPGQARVLPDRDRRSVIMICNLGGPSQLDTWDPKPDAACDVRGPFRPVRTTVPGILVTELFPGHARIAHRLAFVRSCYHTSPALHHSGWQCMQTGREFTQQVETPHMGSLVGHLLGPRAGMPPHVLLPRPLVTGQNGAMTGQSAGVLGVTHDPVIADVCCGQAASGNSTTCADAPALNRALDVTLEPAGVRERYGSAPLGQRCLAARRLVEAGVRWVTINAFTDNVEGPSWDVHGRAPCGGLEQLRQYVAPVYDQAVSALIVDLHQKGLLPETLVCCVAEFGRTPRVNSEGGRDHWPSCFTTYFAGGGVRGGQVVGRSDAVAGEPFERPVVPAQLLATICHTLGLESSTPWMDELGTVRPLVPGAASPVWELF